MSKVCVVGLGKLGSVLAATLANKGHNVIGLDVSKSTVERVNSGQTPVEEPGLQKLMTSAGRKLRATVSASEAVRNSNIAFIVVPTPSREDGKFSNRYILEALENMSPYVTKWYTFVVCSTVMPGSCDGVITEKLEKWTRRTVGKTIGLCYSPEFIALGSVVWDMTHPDMVLLGANDNKSRRALYDVLSTVPEQETNFVSLSLVDAEIAKISVNTYVTMKISFANTLAEICEALPGADAWKVAQAVGGDSRIGVKYLKPGGPYGGPCFPRDTSAFSALALDCGTSAELADATDVINTRQAIRVADMYKKYDRVTILGKSYKPGTPVTDESFAMALIGLLQFEGVRITAWDPHVSLGLLGSEVASSSQEAVDQSDAVVIATAYDEFTKIDYKGKPVLDVWGILPPAPNVRRVGVGL